MPHTFRGLSLICNRRAVYRCRGIFWYCTVLLYFRGIFPLSSTFLVVLLVHQNLGILYIIALINVWLLTHQVMTSWYSFIRVWMRKDADCFIFFAGHPGWQVKASWGPRVWHITFYLKGTQHTRTNDTSKFGFPVWLNLFMETCQIRIDLTLGKFIELA